MIDENFEGFLTAGRKIIASEFPHAARNDDSGRSLPDADPYPEPVPRPGMNRDRIDPLSVLPESNNYPFEDEY